MTNAQTSEILNALKNVPADKIDEVKDFAIFLRERYGRDDIDTSDHRSEEDLAEFARATLDHSEGLDS